MRQLKTAIVDDNHGFQRLLRRVFIRYPFIEVVAGVETGEEMLTRMRETAPDLVTVDINLPGMDGFELARMLKERYPGTRIIFITLNGNPAFREEARKMGCPYIEKDLLLDELSPALESIGAG